MVVKRVKEGYKKTELGWIPEEWDIKRLEEIVDICYGKSQKEVEVYDGKYKILGTGGVMGYTNDYLWNEPSVLIGRKGTIDKPQYIEEPFWTVDTLFYTKLKSNNLAKWLFYYLNNIDLKKYNEATGVPSLSVSNLNTIEILKPPLKEQQKIAEILSTVDSQIDDTDKIIEKTKELKKGLMQRLLTKGIGHKEFKMTEVGEIPVEWEVVDFFEFVDKIVDFRGRTPKKLGLEWGGGNILSLSANNVRMGKIDFESENYYASYELYKRWMSGNELEKHDILMTMEAPLGNVALVPDENKYILSQRVVALKTKEYINNRFMLYMLMSDIVQRQLDALSTGTTAKGINQKNLAKVKVIIPKLKEQKNLARVLSSVDSQIEEYENKKSKLEELKKALMQQLLIGKIRVV